MTTDHIDRAAEVMIEHTRTRIEGCHCGWSKLGASHAEHVARALDAAGLLATPERDAAVAVRALREAADDMDDTDDPDAIHVNNGDIDKWLCVRADRIERGD